MTEVTGAVEYKTNAPKGAELLDRIEPGWASKIDLDIFDIDNTDTCVLAQLYGHTADVVVHSAYYTGQVLLISAAGLEPDPDDSMGVYHLSVEYGFDWERSGDIPALQADWLRLITARQTA
jgi:hypothetical protein